MLFKIFRNIAIIIIMIMNMIIIMIMIIIMSMIIMSIPCRLRKDVRPGL